ncbi:MAG: hypothetical protein QXR19_16360 [Candidatus Jordarchaeaceae archaeon]
MSFVLEGEFDPKVAMLFQKIAITERAKIYGAVYNKLALKYVLEFEAGKLKEEPPQKPS